MQPVKFASGVELLIPHPHDSRLINIDGASGGVVLSFQPQDPLIEVIKLHVRPEAGAIVWAEGLCCPMTVACVSVVIGQADRHWLAERLDSSACDRLLASMADWAVEAKWLILVEALVGDAVAAFGHGPIEGALFEG